MLGLLKLTILVPPEEKGFLIPSPPPHPPN